MAQYLTSASLWLLSLSFTVAAAPQHGGQRGGHRGGQGPDYTVPSLVGPEVDMTTGGPGGTYPRANYLHDGSILAVYTGFANSDNVITTTRSTDLGQSWAHWGTVGTELSAANDFDNPYPLQLPCGRVLVAVRNHSKNATSGAYLYYRISIFASEDNGQTFSPLATPAEHAANPAPYNNGLWEPFMRNALDGSVQLYYSLEDSAADQNQWMQSSYDDGATWTAPVEVIGQNITARDGMIGIAAVQGCNLIAVFESEQNGLFTVNSMTSPDDGKTWVNRQRVYTPTGTNNNAGAPQIVNVGGALAVSFMTDEDTMDHMWITGADDKMVTSGDGGKTWGNKITIFPVQSNWPAMISLNQTSLLYMTDYGGVKSQRVLLGP